MLTKVDVEDTVAGSVTKGDRQSVESTTDMVFMTEVFEVAKVSDLAHKIGRTVFNGW